MRDAILLAGLVVSLSACTTATPDEVCAHLVALDNKEPMANFSDHDVPPHRHGGDKTASCTRQLRGLAAADTTEYRHCAKCVMLSEHSKDAWDCWVLDHLSAKQSPRIATLMACDAKCEAELNSCNDACKTVDACRDKCTNAQEDCVTSCEFD